MWSEGGGEHATLTVITRCRRLRTALQIMDKEQHTAVKKKMTSCVFDHVMFFNLNKLEREEIEEAIITVSVFDADTFSANDLIGLYQFDMKSIYFRPHHEVSAAPGCSVPGAPALVLW